MIRKHSIKFLILTLLLTIFLIPTISNVKAIDLDPGGGGDPGDWISYHSSKGTYDTYYGEAGQWLKIDDVQAHGQYSPSTGRYRITSITFRSYSEFTSKSHFCRVKIGSYVVYEGTFTRSSSWTTYTYNCMFNFNTHHYRVDAKIYLESLGSQKYANSYVYIP